MPLVKVVNDNVHPYEERFRDQTIKIEAGKSIQMEHEDAVMFLGQMNSIKRTVDGGPDPKSFKKLRIEDPKVEKSK